jgi:hypothetical protein
MRYNIVHKVLSYILIIVLLFPIGIGFSNSLENHEHDICTAKKEQHIHARKLNCSYLPYFTNIQSQRQDFTFLALLSHFIYSKQVLSLENFYFLFNTSTCLVRGPPTINAF